MLFTNNNMQAKKNVFFRTCPLYLQIVAFFSVKELCSCLGHLQTEEWQTLIVHENAMDKSIRIKHEKVKSSKSFYMH